MLQLPGGAGEPAGHAAGALRRGESQGDEEARRSISSRSSNGTPDAPRRSSSPAPDFDDKQGSVGSLTFSDFLNLFFFIQEGLGAVLKALEQKGYFQSLAEPNLIAYNGQEASFLAGGEFPCPIVQGRDGNGQRRLQGVRRPPDVPTDDRRRRAFG